MKRLAIAALAFGFIAIAAEAQRRPGGRRSAAVSASTPANVPLGSTELISLSGQSNSVGFSGSPALSTSQPYSNQAWNNTALTALIEPMPGSNTPANSESCASGLANQLTYMDGARASVIDSWGVSGQRCNQLNKGNGVYTSAQTEIGEAWAALSTPKAAGPFVWVQGESDDQQDTTTASYVSCMTQLQTDWETDTKALLGVTYSIPIVTFQEFNFTRASNHEIGTAMVGQWDLARDNSKFILAGVGYAIPAATSDIHYTNAGHRLLGDYLAKAVRTWNRGTRFVPLSPASISCNANVITLVTQGGDYSTGLTIDTTNVVQKPDYGFSYAEDTPQTDLPVITSVASDGANTITITLNRNCSSAAGPRLQYAYSGIPGSTPGPAINGSAGGNIRRTSYAQVAHSDGTTPLYDWLVGFHQSITPCTSCTASSVSSFDHSGSLYVDNSPLGWGAARKQTDLDAATLVTWSFWIRRDSGSWPTSDTVLWARSYSSQRVFDFRARTGGTIRFSLAVSSNDQATYFATAGGVFTGNTWYHVLAEFDGSQQSNATRMRVWVNGAEITGAGGFTGTIPAALQTGLLSEVSFGAESGTETPTATPWYLAQFSEWVGTVLPAPDIATLYGAGTPGDPMSISPQPTHYWPMATNGEDRGIGTAFPVRLYGAGGAFYTAAFHP